ncbi:hypothetical protein [Pendulispora albinea]|uniref:PEGA domain-containing protein n=1 Tax=Pendulispora albinea TaxID=2741071 RepID=A0ABZ2M2K6_9BACT
MRKTHLSILTIALAFGTLALSSSALAQPVSDMDRAAARDLFRRGVELQNNGKFEGALDHFTRANAVVNAPTNMLRIAECHAALGHLVEAVEMYRALQRYPLPPNPPPVFVQAVEQGREEMKTVEPRVPELKIDVAPPQVPTLTVTIDEQPLNAALVGVSRPINPGVHKIAASAPGYTRAEQTVEIKERERKPVTLTLISTGGVIYGPAGAGGSSPYVTISGQPGAAGATPDKPPVYTTEERAKAVDLRSRTSIFLGPRLGAAFASGNYVVSGTSVAMGDIASTGVAFGGEAGIRFARLFYFSVVLEAAKYGDKSEGGIKNSASSFLAGGKFGIITNPDGFAFLGDIGVGYRSFSVEQTAAGVKRNTDANSAEFLVGIGMHFKAGNVLRLVPRIDLGVGSFGSTGTSVSGSKLNDNESHALWMLGLGGYFDINLDKRADAAKSAAAMPPPPSLP